MFRVYLNDQKETYPLYEPLDDELCIYDPVLTQEMGLGGCFKFCILETHPYADRIGLLKSEIMVYRDEKEIFRGRVLKPEYSLEKITTVTVEGDLCYLLDSQQAPYSISGGTEEFIRRMLDVHNSQVDDYKKMYPGIITVADTGSGTARTEKKYSSTLDALDRRLVSELGGYLRVRNEGGKKYLDYLWDYGGINEQVIRFGENMLDLDRYMDATDIITCLIPLGAEVEYKDELGEKQVRTVDITSVNNGKNYIQSDEGIEKYGKVWGTKQWTDITEPEKLLAKGSAYLNETSALPDSMKINALDLSLINEDVREFDLGCWTTVSSDPHGIEKQMLLTKRVINMLDPTSGSIDLGRTVKTFLDKVTKGQQDAMKAVDQVAASASDEINRAVENATKLITGGLGGYVVLDNIDPITGKKAHPWRILIMNTPDKDTAVNVIQINQNGIGFSTTGINGPYRNAWTIDGNLVADFITTGSMLADRIRGGTLELGGTGLGRDGSIIVKDAAGNTIGSWDKTGLSILRGMLQGVSAIFGGVNNQNGAIEVRNASNRTIGRWDKDGIYILQGDITVGPFEATADGVTFGDWEVSADGTNVLRSIDRSVTIQNEQGGPLGRYPAISINGGAQLTEGGLDATQIVSEFVNGDCMLKDNAGTGVSNRRWNNRSLYEILDYLQDQINDIDVGV